MKIRKRILAMLLMTVLLLCVSGCSGSKSTDIEANGTPTLVWYVPGKAQPDVGLVMEKANIIIESAIGAKLDIRFLDDGAFTEKMQMFMASNSEFDLCFTGYLNNYANAVKRDGLLPLWDLLNKETPKLMKQMPDYIWESAKYNGDVYAVPNLQTIAAPNGFMILDDYVKKCNLDLNSVKCMNDMEKLFEKIKPEADKAGKYAYRGKPGVVAWLHKDYEVLPGVPENCLVIKKDGESTTALKTFTLPEYKEGLKTIRKWYEKGYIRPDISTMGSDDADFKQQKYVISQTTAKPGAAESLSAQYNNKFSVFSFNPDYFSIGGANLTMTGISINTKHPEKCVKLIELMNTNKELYNLISYGIEGVHYDLDSEKKVVYKEVSGYSIRKAWAFGNQYNAYLETGQKDDLWEETEKQNRDSVKSALLGFNIDLQNISTEISQIQSVYGKYASINVGSVDPESYYTTFINALETAGYTKLQEEVQRQINEFISKKK